MAIQYITSPDSDYTRGIDARSAENQILAGYVRDLLNGDTIKKRARKRKGYQGYAGNIPVRVTQLIYDDFNNQISFVLDSAVSLDTAISLETVRSSPIVVYGRSKLFASGQGPFTNAGDTVRYYPGFFIPTRKALLQGTGTLSIPASEHGFATTDLFIAVVESTSTTDRSYQKIITNSIRINKITFDVSIDYTAFQTTEVFVYFADKSPATGSVYAATLSHGGAGSQSFTITEATHGLSNLDIIPQLQQDIGGEMQQTIADSFTIAPNGDVTVVINSSSAATYRLILSTAPLINLASGVVAGNSTGTITFPAQNPIWLFMGIYLETTPIGTRELVLPDTIVYDDIAQLYTLTFTNNNATALNFTAFFDSGNLRSNILTVSDSSMTTSGTDIAPQLTIWGLDHAEIYQMKSNREGWSNHIDSYRRAAEERIITGLGGNLFAAREYIEAATTYLYPQLYPNLRNRAASAQVLAPLFWDTGETPMRSRGYITGDDSATHWASISSVSFDSGNGWTKYTIDIPNKLILDSVGNPTALSTVISTTSNLEDYLDVQDMSYARHNGTFEIKQVQDGTNQIFIWVENTSNSADYDDSNTMGQAGVFTDQVAWQSASTFIPGDTSLSEALGNTVCHILSSASSISVLDGIIDLIQVPAGVVFTAERLSSVVPLRPQDLTQPATVTDLVRGDMLSYTGIPRLLRVLDINTNTDLSVSVVSGVLTLGSSDTTGFRVGEKILLAEAGEYTGVQTISDITSASTLVLDSTNTTTSSGVLVGKTMQVDEELDWSDVQDSSTTFRVEERWIPVEAPDDSFNMTAHTHVRYFDSEPYTAQPFLRSNMVVDNMYLTNNEDENYKFDSTNNYRSGLIAWQPGLFLTQETSGAAIVSDRRSVSYSAILAGAGKLTIAIADENIIPVGGSVRLTGSSETYTVQNYTDDGTNGYLIVDRTLDGSVSATGTVGEIAIYRYYFRLNAVDANNNIIASAATGSQDHVVELTANAAVQLKLVGLPVWDVYDYDRLEVQIYRTKQNTAAPFYLVTTIPMSFDNGAGYINYKDTFADQDLTGLDVVNTTLKGSELGTNFSDPLRAKYVTSINNRMVLGNITDYPEMEMQIVGNATLSNSDLTGSRFFFRKDSTDVATTSDLTNRIGYELIDTTTGTAASPTVGLNLFSFDGGAGASGATSSDWVYLYYSTTATTGRDLTYCGWWQINNVAGTVVSVFLPGAVAVTSYPDSYVLASNHGDVPVYIGTDGNMGMVNGDSFATFNAPRKLSMAINASMRQVLFGSHGDFIPWLVSRSGNDLDVAGKIVIRQPRADVLEFSMTPTYSGYSLFINGTAAPTSIATLPRTRVFPSRLLFSYENYAEVFDSPTTVLDSDSDSAIDVNSADGQQITGIVPFFGQAVFGAAQQATILAVFKTNSIYLVDINEKVAGRNPIQKIETEGLGCTAPYSIAVTKNGIMFANQSGIYCLRRTQAIEYIGEYMERNWLERVDTNRLDLAQGHHYGIGRAYKLSLPLTENVQTNGYIENSQVFVYDHTAETQGEYGSWGQYDNHAATGWANLAPDAYFGATVGRVFSIRNTGTTTDFRDDSSSINFQLDPRPNSFGNDGIRKIVDKIIIHYRIGADNTGTSLLYSVDLESEYQPTTAFDLNTGETRTGIGDPITRDLVSLRHSIGRRRCIYIGLRIQNDTIDEDIEIAGIDYKIGGLSEKGIQSAASTK